ncbi:MAG: hypothetical protein JO061_12645 [Acidobacteriaceae bacterium]|nr:hypothetical protein [Acidobacteriaceae bacterium]
MQQTTSSGTPSGYSETALNREAHSSGVSWAAVLAGAIVAAALSLTLLSLGAGFGLLTLSPWSNAGASASAVDTGAIIWLIVIQIVASGIGGYVAGRLRTKWTAIHTDEVYFRDTAHGFLVWAVAVVVTAAFLGSAATALVGGLATGTEMGGPENAYFVDELFRPAPGVTTAPTENAPAARAEDSAVRGEAAVILANALRQGEAGAADRAYLAQLVSARTGVNQNDATQRVSGVIVQAREAADEARKATARWLLWTFLALLIGAFCASYAATIGGRQRDHMKAI